jgi:hypothetical protein
MSNETAPPMTKRIPAQTVEVPRPGRGSLAAYLAMPEDATMAPGMVVWARTLAFFAKHLRGSGRRP